MIHPYLNWTGKKKINLPWQQINIVYSKKQNQKREKSSKQTKKKHY